MVKAVKGKVSLGGFNVIGLTRKVISYPASCWNEAGFNEIRWGGFRRKHPKMKGLTAKRNKKEDRIIL